MRRIIFLTLTLLVVVFGLGACQPTPTQTPYPTHTPFPTPTVVTFMNPLPIAGSLQLATVTRVVDGDTIDVLLGGQEVRLRLIGLDTPETVDPGKPVQCYGMEASAKAKELLTGKTVGLEADPTQGELGKYGRLLRYVWLTDDRLYNMEMVAQGYAHEYTYDLPYKYQFEFQEAQMQAMEENRGLWHPDTCAGNTYQAASNQLGSATLSPQTGFRYDPFGPDRNCGDFASWQEAQAFYEAAGGPTTDLHRLDGDRDGIACESLLGAP